MPDDTPQAPRRALIEITRVDLRETNTHLARIADALETLLREAYGVSLRDTPVTRHPDDPDAITYVDENEELRREIEETIRPGAVETVDSTD